MPITAPAWKVTDTSDNLCYVYHDETEAGALNQHADEFSVDPWDLAEWFVVERCEAMDGLEPTAYNAMVTGVITSAQEHCICGSTLWADSGEGGELFISSMDPDYGVEGRRAVLSGQSGEIYCSDTCLWKAEGP